MVESVDSAETYWPFLRWRMEAHHTTPIVHVSTGEPVAVFKPSTHSFDLILVLGHYINGKVATHKYFGQLSITIMDGWFSLMF